MTSRLIPYDVVIKIVTESLQQYIIHSTTEKNDACTQTVTEEHIGVIDTTNETRNEEIDMLLHICATEYPVLLEISNNTIYCFNYINNILFGSNREIDFHFCKEQFWYDCDRLLKVKKHKAILESLCRLGCILAEKVESENKKNAKFSVKTNVL